MLDGKKTYIDLSGIPIMSSSFADEAFCKLLVEAAAAMFTQKFEFIKVMETIQYLIDKAITQRMSANITD